MTERLDELVFRYLERVEEGEAAAGVLAELCSANPGEAEALRRGVGLLFEVQLHPGPGADGLPERIGPFRLLRRLGAGGMGVVYLAEQENPARRVALKLVRPDQLWFEGYRERFAREIESAGRLAHPGIAPVYEMGEEGGVPWFSQEYVVGAPLSALLANAPARSPESLTGADLRATLADALEEPVPASAWDEEFFRGSWVDVCVRIAQQVAGALQHAHERGVLHRDVKPSNALLTPGGRAVLVDFGLASLQGTERLTQTGAQVGSLHYMSPEQIDGRPAEIGPRSDVYSLGVTLYELLTLRAPYASRSVQRLRGMILEGAAPELREVNRAVPRDVNVVVRCAMDPAPERRYETAAAFAADLAAAATHRPIAARPAGPGLRVARWVRRRPAAAVAIASGFLLLVVAPTAFGVQSLLAAREQEQLNLELGRTLDQRDVLLDATLSGFESVVRETAHGSLRDVPGFQAQRLEVIDEGLSIFARVVAARPEDFEVRLQQALMTRTRANILHQLGRSAEAVQQYEQAARTFELAAARPDCDPRWLRELSSLRFMQAKSVPGIEAVALSRAALAHQRRAIELAPGDPHHRADLAGMTGALANDLYSREGRPEEAYTLLDESIAAARHLTLLSPDDPYAHRALYEGLGTRSDWHVFEGRLVEAEADHSAACAALERALALAPGDRTLREHRVEALSGEASLVLQRTRDTEAAMPVLERALELCDALIADYPAVPEYAEKRFDVLGAISFARGLAGDRAGAREVQEQIVAARLVRAEADPEDGQKSLDAAGSQVNLVNRLLFDESLGEGRFDRMLELCDQIDERIADYRRTNPDSFAVRQVRMYVAYGRGCAWIRLDWAEGVRDEIEALRELDHDLPHRYYFTGLLWMAWSELTGDERGLRDAVDELERAVEAGFDDLGAWEETDVDEDCAGDPRMAGLLETLRSRAKQTKR